jgi:hypothetical protein
MDYWSIKVAVAESEGRLAVGSPFFPELSLSDQ